MVMQSSGDRSEGASDAPRDPSIGSRAREASSEAPPAGEGEARIEYMDIDRVPPAPRNAKKHDKAGIRRAFEQFGFIDPPIVNEATGRLVAGHGRIEELQAMRAKRKKPPRRIRVAADGTWWLPVIRGIAFETDEKAELYLLASNKLVENEGYDEEILADILRDYSKEDALIAGYDSTEVDKLLMPPLEIEAPRASNEGGETETFTFRKVRIKISTDTADAFALALEAYAEERGTYNGFVEMVIRCLSKNTQ